MSVLKKGTRVFLAGHRGLVGSAVCRRLVSDGQADVLLRDRSELDLTDAVAVSAFLRHEKPDLVILAAALVGGIQANRTRPADFIAANLGIQQSVIWGSHLADVPSLLFLGSSCVYPRETPQPIPETALLSGPLEPTNAPYAVAKIAGLTMCDAIRRQYGRTYFSVMPPNVFGPGDNFDPQASHVMAAMIRRFHQALPDRSVVCWGTGRPKREFLHCDEVADALVFLLGLPDPPPIVNIGTGTSVTVRELAETVQRVVGHAGPVSWDSSMPDGFPEKTNDVALLHSLGWRHKMSLEEGVRDAYAWFLRNVAA